MSVICKTKWPNIKGDNSATMYSIYPSIRLWPGPFRSSVGRLFWCLNPRPLNLINGLLTRLSDPTIQTLKYVLNSHPVVCFGGGGESPADVIQPVKLRILSTLMDECANTAPPPTSSCVCKETCCKHHEEKTVFT